MTDRERRDDRTWSEEIEVASRELVDRVKGWIEDASVQRVIIRHPDGHTLLELPVGAGAAMVGALVVYAPVLAAVGAMAGLVADFKVEIVRRDDGED